MADFPRFYSTANALYCEPDTNRRFIYSSDDHRLLVTLNMHGGEWTKERATALSHVEKASDLRELRDRLLDAKLLDWYVNDRDLNVGPWDG